MPRWTYKTTFAQNVHFYEIMSCMLDPCFQGQAHTLRSEVKNKLIKAHTDFKLAVY